MNIMLIVSVFTPDKISSLHNFFYWVSYFSVFLSNFTIVSLLVTLYVKYVFIFQPEMTENIVIKRLRWKCLMWKILLTILVMLLNIAVPSTDPAIFQYLTKGQVYDR